MPVIKSAIKKMRQSLVREAKNRGVKTAVKKLIDKYRKSPTASLLPKVMSALDKAAKTNVIHKNKAARLKSRLSKLLAGGKPAAKVTTASTKKPRKKK